MQVEQLEIGILQNLTIREYNIASVKSFLQFGFLITSDNNVDKELKRCIFLAGEVKISWNYTEPTTIQLSQKIQVGKRIKRRPKLRYMEKIEQKIALLKIKKLTNKTRNR